jgi:hypothetical protein
MLATCLLNVRIPRLPSACSLASPTPPSPEAFFHNPLPHSAGASKNAESFAASFPSVVWTGLDLGLFTWYGGRVTQTIGADTLAVNFFVYMHPHSARPYSKNVPFGFSVLFTSGASPLFILLNR